MSNLFNKLKYKYQLGGNLKKLLYINIGIFIIYQFLIIFGFLFEINTIKDFFRNFLYLPANTTILINRPWTLFTYMFIHFDFLHIIFNLIWLYFGSKLFLHFLSQKQLISTYILGGLSGGLSYIIAYNLFPVFEDSILTSKAIGASASVLAIFIAIATHAPNHILRLYLIGNIKLKYIAITIIILDLLLWAIKIDGVFATDLENSGGHIAHIGGAFYGFFYIILLNKGFDLSINYQNFINIFNNQKKERKTRNQQNNDDIFRNNKAKKQDEINLILEKISQSGYESLTKEEKETLFKESKK